MDATLTVMKSGNSTVVALPAEWRKKSGIKPGDKLTVTYSDNMTISFSKAGEAKGRREAALARIAKRAESMPRIPWDNDSREDDRRLLEQRYE